MRVGLFFLVYLVVGRLVAGGIIGKDGSYFSGLNNLEELIEMVLAVLLWPLVLLGVNINIGGDGSGRASSDAGAGGGGGQVTPRWARRDGFSIAPANGP